MAYSPILGLLVDCKLPTAYSLEPSIPGPHGFRSNFSFENQIDVILNSIKDPFDIFFRKVVIRIIIGTQDKNFLDLITQCQIQHELAANRQRKSLRHN